MAPSDLNAVAIFVKVIELRSFSAAARALGIPKSTVSKKVIELEDWLGARLIERTTRTLRPTDAGTTYLRRAQPALDALDEAARAVEDLRAEPSGHLRVTTTFEGGQLLLAPVLVEYARRFPRVELHVELADRHVDLIAEGFDLALRGGALPDSTLIARPLDPGSALRIYGSPAYLRRCPPPRRPEDLAAHDCLIMTSQIRPATWSFLVKRKVVAVDVRTRAGANSFVVLRELAAAGVGLARLPEYLAAELHGAGKLRTVLDAFAVDPIPWHAVYPSARNLSPKVRALVTLLEEWFGRGPGQSRRQGPLEPVRAGDE